MVTDEMIERARNAGRDLAGSGVPNALREACGEVAVTGLMSGMRGVDVIGLMEALEAAEIVIAEVCVGQHHDNVCCHTLRAVRAAIAKAKGV